MPEAPSNSAKLVDTSEAFRNTSPIKRSLFLMAKPTLEHLLGIRKINRLYQSIQSKKGSDSITGFSEAVLSELRIAYELPSDAELDVYRSYKGPLVMLANHPFGGLEALVMFLLMSKIRPEYRVMANFLLSRVNEMRDHLILVDPFDEQDSATRNVAPLKEALHYLKNGGFLGLFPSGEVAALQLRSGRIREPDWNPNVAKLIRRTGAAVIPVYFRGTNSALFHLAGVVNPRLRTSLLVREFVNPPRRRIDLQVGSLISPKSMEPYAAPEDLAKFLRSKIFLLSLRYPRRRWGLPLAPLAKLRRKSSVEPVAEAEDPLSLQEEILGLPPQQLLLQQGDLQVWMFTAEQAPHLLRELGRVREITFRAVGEGTGAPMDLGDYDLHYDHLILWDVVRHQIAGSYRLAKVDVMRARHGDAGVYVSTSFKIDPAFFDSLPNAIECSRAFVAGEYQRNVHTLSLLWAGIGQYVLRDPRYTTLIGCLSVSADFHLAAQNFLVQFLEDYHLDAYRAQFVKPYVPFVKKRKLIEEHYRAYSLRGLADVQELISQVDEREQRIPVLLRQYLKLGAKCVGFNIDPNFSNVLDVLIYTDLREAPPILMKKYLTEQGYARYRAFHNLPALDATAAQASPAAP